MTHRWWQWRHLSQAERVEQYTVQTLHCVLWAFPVLALMVAMAAPRDESSLFYLVMVGLLVHAATGSKLLGTAVRARSDRPAIPRTWLIASLSLGALLVIVALLTSRPGEVGGALTTMTVTAVWGVSAMSLLSFRRLPLDALVMVTSLLWPLANGSEHPFAVVFSMVLGLVAGVFLLGTMRSSLWLLRVVRELDEARAAQAQLAVAEERLRFSRDVHDVMGRQLSAIAVQAELAAALAQRDKPAEAETTMLGVRRLAHDALREARELARGYRTPDLAQEVSGAAELLRAAGIECHTALADLPDAVHEPAAWVIREAVTNVLRHSSATRVEITWVDGVLTVHNNGANAPAAESGGSGLVGLRERLAAMGGTLNVHHDGADYAIEAVLM